MKILIVEDDPIMMMLLTQSVKNFGYIIISAADGKEAIHSINKESPDMVITDLTLPIISGLEIISYVKDFPGKIIPVILISAMPKNALGNTDDDFGADAYLVKPVSPQLLINTISRLEFVSRNPLQFYCRS